ncbi:hypothetical protein AURDEDRAFT_114584 [Auricularia subglabra TFB-10046 SS5]|nr:hypothetical protein AURDEDRAFT_114584 [Auricularia subglabra TFB-10046 SS5]
MFVAVELSSDKGEAVGTVTRTLLARLQALDKREYSDLLARAFPNGDKGFMAAFKMVHEREVNRINMMHDDYCDARTDPEELHRARHDMESLFWVTFWALLRASPLFVPPDDASGDALKWLGDSMLDHKLGYETFRSTLWASSNLTSGMHLLLRERVGPLLRDMAAYVSIPWHRYTATVPDLPQNHAHIAFTRMLIVEIHQLSNSSDILFDRNVPRNLRTVKNFNQDNSTKPKRPLGTGSKPATRLSQDVLRRSAGRVTAGAAEDGQARTTREAASQRGTKRGTGSRDVDDGASAPEDGEARTTREVASQRGTKRGTGTRDVEDGAGEPTPPPKRAKRAAGSPEAGETRDISTLVDMFFDDRVLWFGVGDREKTKAAANTQGNTTAQAGPSAGEGKTTVAGTDPNDAAHDDATTVDSVDKPDAEARDD